MTTETPAVTEAPIELHFSDIPFVATRQTKANPWAVALKDVPDGVAVTINIDVDTLKATQAAIRTGVKVLGKGIKFQIIPAGSGHPEAPTDEKMVAVKFVLGVKRTTGF